MRIEVDETVGTPVVVRDPERNRLREVSADQTTYEVTRLVANDRLYVGCQIYDTTFDIHVCMLAGRPIVTSIHGAVGQAADGSAYFGDGKSVDYTLSNIKFLSKMPDWYFNARTHAAHQNDLPA